MRFSEAFGVEGRQVALDFLDIPLHTDLRFFFRSNIYKGFKIPMGAGFSLRVTRLFYRNNGVYKK